MVSEKPVAELSFEEAMAALEAVVTQLESGSAPLDQAIALYERGAALRQHCEDKLQKAEEKVALIALGPDGRPTGTKPLENP